jgi:hypothetical protein
MTESESETSAPSANPPCPRCGGDMWDNREGKRNPRAPDYKCKDKGCDGVIWPPRDAARTAAPATTTADGPKVDASGMPLCPVCGGPMWDDRLSKRNPRAPDFKCRNKPKERGGPGCEGIIWPPRSGASPYPPPVPRGERRPPSSESAGAPTRDDAPPPIEGAHPDDDDDIPF